MNNLKVDHGWGIFSNEPSTQGENSVVQSKSISKNNDSIIEKEGDKKGKKTKKDSGIEDGGIQYIEKEEDNGIAIAVAFVDDKAPLGIGDNRKVFQGLNKFIKKLNGNKTPK